MKRYLLFDSGCNLCSKLAKAIEQEADGKLTIRSLRDPAVKELLDRERPGWKWEPMLVEEKGDKVRIYAGRAMSRRLLVVLGPRRAFRVIQMVSAVGEGVQPVDTERRAFLRQGVALLAVGALFPGITKGLWQSDASLSGYDENAAHSSLAAKGITPGSEIREDVKERIRKAIVRNSAFQYMYLASTNKKQMDLSKVAQHLEVIGYESQHHLYLVGLRLPESNDRVLAMLYEQRANRVLGIVSASQNKVNDDINIYLDHIDSKMHVLVPEGQVDRSRIVSFQKVSIDEQIALKTGFKLEQVSATGKTASSSSPMEEPESLVCHIVCHLTGALLCDWWNPLVCTIVTILVCGLVCTEPVS